MQEIAICLLAVSCMFNTLSLRWARQRMDQQEDRLRRLIDAIAKYERSKS